MTRAYQTSRARRVTQPITIIRPRDPTIRTLGFTCFRALDIGDAELVVVAHSDRKNAMSAFTNLGR